MDGVGGTVGVWLVLQLGVGNRVRVGLMLKPAAEVSHTRSLSQLGVRRRTTVHVPKENVIHHTSVRDAALEATS